jgi:hypothetical protein
MFTDKFSWEPVESFEGSENLIDQFWARADTAGRDTKDLNLFKPGEEFFAVGPPRMSSNNLITELFTALTKFCRS